jgi:hypothetical protein
MARIRTINLNSAKLRHIVKDYVRSKLGLDTNNFKAVLDLQDVESLLENLDYETGVVLIDAPEIHYGRNYMSKMSSESLRRAIAEHVEKRGYELSSDPNAINFRFIMHKEDLEEIRKRGHDYCGPVEGMIEARVYIKDTKPLTLVSYLWVDNK